MKLATFIFLVLTAYLINEYRLIRKYARALEKANKK